ncbi:hypothetical protein QTI66_33300 [Variovorax sp. J22R133]|uniref:hypothetical protein n=1 Tax=Variovorax brevis TaxID=3053503 RepID=UPI002577DB53|nr:hypothetical protein [Variovorax sp. J22R133]MDM0117002.1 hypothetical protein [Variovorax sp. J22R133]
MESLTRHEDRSRHKAASRWYVLGWASAWIVLGAVAASQLGKFAGDDRGMDTFISSIAIALAGAAAFLKAAIATMRQTKPAAATALTVASLAGVTVSIGLLYNARIDDARVDSAIAASAYFLLSFIASCVTLVLGQRMRERERERSIRRKQLAQQRHDRDLEGRDERYREMRASFTDYLHVVADNDADVRRNRAK